MATITRGNVDTAVTAIKAALDRYESDFPRATADVYRQNSASVRVRVVDERFASLSKAERHDEVWNYLARHLTDDQQSEISVLLTLAPGEQSESLMNIEFDHPTRSWL